MTKTTVFTTILLSIVVLGQAFHSPFLSRSAVRTPRSILRHPNLQPSLSLAASEPSSGDMLSTTGDEFATLSPLTKVLYTIGGTTSIVVSFTFFGVLAYQRDALMVSFFVGSIANGVLGKVLKRVLNQDRPEPVDGAIEKPSDKGMPSSHAMSLGFIGTFTALTLPWTQPLIPLYAATSLFYRIQTKLHTPDQIAVGVLVGSMNGFLWRHLVDGTNPLGIHVMDFVSNNFLNDQGLLPIPMLIVPALVGFVVVGSLERKISKWLKKQTKDD